MKNESTQILIIYLSSESNSVSFDDLITISPWPASSKNDLSNTSSGTKSSKLLMFPMVGIFVTGSSLGISTSLSKSNKYFT